jgi:glycosyltransferase involved in cell wall biosynthesis
MKPRVVYWNNIPSPYMVERFNCLSRRGIIAFEAWFSARSEPDRSWTVDEATWEFPYRYLPAVHLGDAQLAIPSGLVRGRVPDVLVSLHSGLPFLSGWAIARARGIRTAFWVTATYDSWVKRRRWKEAIKRIVFPRVDAILTTGEDGREFALRYGARADRVFTLPHFVDYDTFASARTSARRRRDTTRKELGLRGVTFIYVGRMWSGKGLVFLLDAYAAIERRNPEQVSLVLVGDGPDEEVLRRSCGDQGLKNVVFTGFRQRDELPLLYAASDVFVFPTLGDPFGHVVGEAMSSGLPVVTTSAAGEIRDRVEDGVNGFVVPPANSVALRERMEALIDSSELRGKMGAASLQKAAGQTPDRWAQGFERAVDQIMSSSSGTDPR